MPSARDYHRRMAVDVETSIEIDCPRAVVSAFVTNPDNAPHWYANIASTDWRTPPPLAVGSRIAFVARFLGRRISYTYEIRELVEGARLVMRTAEGPFPMQTAYTWQDTPSGGTRMTLRNSGEPSGFGTVSGSGDGRSDAESEPEGPRATQANPRDTALTQANRLSAGSRFRVHPSQVRRAGRIREICGGPPSRRSTAGRRVATEEQESV